MSELIDQLSAELKAKIENFQPDLQIYSYGRVIEAGDGIALVDGFSKVGFQEMVIFENGIRGVAFNLSLNNTGIIILGDHSKITEGSKVYTTGRSVSIPTGACMLGRVINPLGEPLDDKGPITSEIYRPIERQAPGILDRQDVDTPLQTGIKAIDAMIPIGRGQRELIIGDRQTGKTALAIDTIINQKGKDVLCIYVAIGQKKSFVAQTINELERRGSMDYTIVVLAAADDPAAMQYIAPYAGCTLGEAFMDLGQDALVVYDDLTKHAWAYRELSLLMRRPPGREAFPGDIFYLHARLLERSARMANQYIIVPQDHQSELADVPESINGKIYRGPRSLHNVEVDISDLDEPSDYKCARIRESGGSLTALPIIETQMGDVSAYIPTNIISITDGQIYLEENLFHAGIRPAINVGISVSRVGGDAQTTAMKQVAAKLRLDMALYNELAAFAQFGADLDDATKNLLNRGIHQQEILKQAQYSPMSLAQEIIILFAGNNGYADKIPKERMREWEFDLQVFIESGFAEIPKDIEAKKSISPETEKKLREAIDTFNITWIS